jgi:hypothetical protein
VVLYEKLILVPQSFGMVNCWKMSEFKKVPGVGPGFPTIAKYVPPAGPILYDCVSGSHAVVFTSANPE